MHRKVVGSPASRVYPKLAVSVVLLLYLTTINQYTGLNLLFEEFPINYTENERIVESEWVESITDANFKPFTWVNERWPNFTNSFYWTSRPENREIVPIPVENIFRAKGKYFEFDNCYANNNMIINDNCALLYDWNEKNPTIRMHVEGIVRVAICVRKHWDTYGHAIHDLLAMLVLYPEVVLAQKPTIFHNWDAKLLSEHLSALGMGDFPIAPDTHTYFFVKKMYYIHPKEHAHEMVGLGLYRMHQLYREHMNLTSIEPTKYRLINRRPTERRYFTNFPELIQELTRTFPKYVWEEMFLQNTLVENAKLFSECKFLIGSGGSLLYNCMFMRNETGVVIFFGDLIDSPNLILFGLLNIYCGGITHVDVSHHDGQGPCNIKQAIDLSGKILYAIEHKEYPYMKGYFPAFNLTRIWKERMKESYDNFAGWANEEPLIP